MINFTRHVRGSGQPSLRYGVALAAAVSMSTLPAGAFSLFGVHLWGEKEEDKAPVTIIDPLPYQAALVMVEDTDDLRAIVTGASGLLSRVDQPALGRAGLLSAANADYGRILDALYAEGHFGAVVSVKIDGREASKLPLDVSLAKKPSIIVEVRPGPLYRFGRIDFENQADGLDPLGLGLLPGEPAVASSITDATASTLEEWQRLGHAKPSVDGFSMVADHATKTVDLDIAVDPGRQARYGTTHVEGTDDMDEDFVAYITGLEEGDTYDGDEVRAARQRLVKLDTFRSVIIEQGEKIAPDGSIDMHVRVEDREPRRIGVGVTLSSLDGLSLEGFWLHRNVRRKARRIRVDGAVRGIGRSDNPEDFDYEARLAYTQPGAFNPDTDFTLSFGVDQEVTQIVRSFNLKTSARLDTRFSPELTGSFALFNERSNTEDDLGERFFSVNGIEAGLTFDSRDSALDPTEGYYLSGTVTPFIEFADDLSGIKAETEARVYRKLDRAGRFVVAGRLSYGFTRGVDIDEAPPGMLFLGGGGGSVRGYDYNDIGTFFNNAETGGRSRLEMSGELRYQINDTFQIVGFGDAGLVGPDPTPDWDAPFRKSAGLGVRFATGLGPIRLDLARAIDRRARDPEFGFYIGLGQSF